VVALIGYLHHRRHPLFLHAGERRYLRPDRPILTALVRKGLPMGLQMIVLSGSSIVMISLVNRFGSQTTAAFGAAMQLWNYVMMPALAVGMAASAMAAQNVGAKRFDRVQRVAATGVGFNLLMTGGLVTLIYLFNRGALGLFLPAEGDAIVVAQHINAIVLWSFMLIGIAMVLGGVVRATGAAVPPLVVLFLALFVVRIPFAFLMSGRWHAEAVWWSFPLGSGAAALFMWLYYRRGSWKRAHMLEPRAVAVSAE
jgi:Na+-driven multidrug efflux pump